ncbi:MAG: AMP-binding protein [Myxococcales bacterium]|nr:AMP-binding protein [Myxococcales bacterium]
MQVAVTAREDPERYAIRCEPHFDLTFSELNERANRLASTLYAQGLQSGDAVALVCSNRPEYADVWAACARAGFRLTTINWHLGADEIAYIADNCEARALIGDFVFANALAEAATRSPKAGVRLALGGSIEGFEPYEAALEAGSPDDLELPVQGSTMLYTSGTTGRPKGVYRRQTPVARAGLFIEILKTAGFDPPNDVCLCTGPLYHAAPLAFNLSVPINAGTGVVLMDQWDAEETLRLIDRYRVTHTHMVATMFHRLIGLPEEVKRGYDTSSLRYVIHGAAPTPVHVKQAMIEWLGPVVYEYYAATEGGGTYITPEEWLEKPGSVGRAVPGQVIEVRDDLGERALAPNEVGAVYFKAPEVGRFEYFKDRDKTSSAYSPDGAFFTLRDVGYFDEDGYLFLTGRTAELIISGGVNIYPAEVDAVLLMHPDVADVAAVGVPSEEWGEEVKAVVLPKDPAAAGERLAGELVEFCRARLAHYKCPRSVDFVADLPRHDTGKIYRRLVREPYWEGRERKL